MQLDLSRINFIIQSFLYTCQDHIWGLKFRSLDSGFLQLSKDVPTLCGLNTCRDPQAKAKTNMFFSVRDSLKNNYLTSGLGKASRPSKK